MSVFTTGHGQVFHAGTYFPPQRMGRVPSFTEVCEAVWEAWAQRREQVQQQAQQMAASLGDQRRRHSQLATAVTVGHDEHQGETITRVNYEELAHSALQILGEDADTVHGGFGAAPKFPPLPLLTWLLEEPAGFVLAEQTMTAMARSALFDQVEGGFARYATDRAWALPHFEKMLSDNAQLIGAYARLSVHHSAQAATAAGLTAEQAQQLTQLNWGVPADEHASARGEPVHITTSTARTIHFDAPLEKPGYDLWEAVLPQLRSRRAQRRQPARDDKVVAAWNAQAVQSVATAGALWEDPRALQLAESLGERLWGTHAQFVGAHEDSDRSQIQISRTSYAGAAGPNPGTLADHAHTAHACFTLASTGASAHQWAERGLAVLQFVLTKFVADNDGELQVLDALDAEGLLAEAQGGAAEATPVDGPEPSSIAALVQALQLPEALGHSSRLPAVGGPGEADPAGPAAPSADDHSSGAPRGRGLAAGGPPCGAGIAGLPSLQRSTSRSRRSQTQRGAPRSSHRPVDPGGVGQGRPLQVSICLNSPAAAVCLAPSSSVDSALAGLD